MVQFSRYGAGSMLTKVVLARLVSASLVLATLVSAVLLAFGPAAAQTPEAGVVGHVEAVTGPATLVHPPDALPVAEGVPVASGDRLVTGDGARVAVRFADGSRVVIGARSDVVVSQYRMSAEGVRSRGILSVLGGILRAVVAPGADGGGFDVRSRGAVASVRSTEFVVSAGPEATAVFTVEGLVAVAPTGAPEATVPVGPGEGVDVPVGATAGTAIPVNRWGQARVDRVLAATADP
jgi:hypothetical protein